eukprot:CAMPEP_0175151040 /NCGR_PEP_ID=MMETSP0087-20121206/18249_1 /TAXON_ID=136419 /ORGANISM="Unknown Unknown, Strain D1" /LENGTH=282 /DNA_ID=CAMNT_0016437141 /DNA_START=44 /DNA_END=892 /DNA_ORIENTATION=-
MEEEERHLEGSGLPRFSSFELEFHTPSRAAEQPIDFQTESSKRYDAATFIQKLGEEAKVDQSCIAMATTYFHLFYCRHSFQQYKRHVLAVTCMYVAGKICEYNKKKKPKDEKEIIVGFRDCLLQCFASIFYSKKDKAKTPPWKKLRKTLWAEVCAAEELLLDTIEYNFSITSPYTHLMERLRALQEQNIYTCTEEVQHAAWYFLNDSLHKSVCLQYSPQTIATAAIRMALLLKGPEPASKGLFLEEDVSALDAIGLQMMDSFENSSVSLLNYDFSSSGKFIA